MVTEEVIVEHEVAVAVGAVDHILVKDMVVARSGSRETKSRVLLIPTGDLTEQEKMVNLRNATTANQSTII